MRKLWCVVVGKWNGKDGKDYYDSWAESFTMYDDMLKLCKMLHIIDIRPCETRKDAQSIAGSNNELYKKQGNYAVANANLIFELRGAIT